MRIPPRPRQRCSWTWPVALALAVTLAGIQTASSDEAKDLLGKARTNAAGASDAAGQAVASVPGHDGASTWVFIVSVLEWQDSASFSSFPKDNRRDALLIKFFRHTRKVPDDHIVWLVEPNAKRDFTRIRFIELLQRAKPGDTLFFYYAGHGSRRQPGVTYLIPYDAKGGDDLPATSWAMPDVVKDIEAHFKGSTAFLTADCCFSGGLCQAAKKHGSRVSYACLTSAQSSNPSTGEWTFSDSLLRGLTGSSRPDSDGDKQILFDELAAYVEKEMSFEGQLSASQVTGKFDPRTRIADVSYQDAAPAPKATVRWQDGKDYSATITGDCTTSAGKRGKTVHYVGYKKSADECVAADTVWPYQPEAQKLPLNKTVYVDWEGTWYEATLLRYKLGLYQVHYDGWSDYWEEWANSSRIRKEAPCGPVPCKP